MYARCCVLLILEKARLLEIVEGALNSNSLEIQLDLCRSKASQGRLVK